MNARMFPYKETTILALPYLMTPRKLVVDFVSFFFYKDIILKRSIYAYWLILIRS